MREKASLTDLKTTWTLADLLQCHDALVIWDKVRADVMKDEV